MKQFLFTIKQVSRHWSRSSTSLLLQNNCHFKAKSSKSVEYLSRAADCNLHSLNAATDPNLFQSILFK